MSLLLNHIGIDFPKVDSENGLNKLHISKRNRNAGAISVGLEVDAGAHYQDKLCEQTTADNRGYEKNSKGNVKDEEGCTPTATRPGIIVPGRTR